ncbi:MAG: MFS transporter [Bacteriovoracaceae bacterium]|nr:MFS transporter [Bacteriovoracaceae bacterium]
MTSENDKSIFTDRKFWPLFWTQFLGAFNDNVFKNALVILITYQSYKLGVLGPKEMVALCGGIFILPFFLFSATAGQIADKFSKSRLIVYVKVWEVFVMIVASVGFMLESVPTLLISLFFMGLQSAFFGPIKYSILPDLLNDREIVTGNAYVGMGTFLSILLGTIVGGIVIGLSSTLGYLPICAIIITLASIGVWTSTKMPEVKASNPELDFKYNPITPTWRILKLTKKTRSVFLSILGISWFWFMGAALLSLIPPYVKEFLNGDENVVTLFLALFSVGVGMGSMICEKLSFKKLELGLVPIGSIGLSIFLLDLFFAGKIGESTGVLTVSAILSNLQGIRVVVDLFLFSVFSGFFIVPLYTLVQLRTEPEVRSQTVAGNNIFNALFMVVASVFLIVLINLKVTIPQMFLIFSIINFAVASYIYTVIPEFLFRFGCWMAAHIFYRYQVSGKENIPDEGPAVIVCNHISFVDWLLISSGCHRPIRFVMHYRFLKIPFAGRLLKDAKVIPIAGYKENQKMFHQAFETISNELKAGELVCIFPEGKLTSDGEISEFKKGVEKIVEKDPVNVIPINIHGMWGSFFSRKDNLAMKKPFRRFFSKVKLSIGAAIDPGSAKVDLLYDKVKSLGESDKVA